MTFNSINNLSKYIQKVFILKINLFGKILLIIILISATCCKKQLTEIRYYPDEKIFQNENKIVIGLDTTQLNFKQITDKIGNYYSSFGTVAVEFNDKNIKKIITPFVYDGGLIQERNILEIKSDSILVGEGYPISELNKILKRHYLNKGQLPNYSKSPYEALIEVTIDTSMSGNDLKQVLLILTQAFDEIQSEVTDSIKLNVFFDYFRQTKVPPPSPSKNDQLEIKF